MTSKGPCQGVSPYRQKEALDQQVHAAGAQFAAHAATKAAQNPHVQAAVGSALREAAIESAKKAKHGFFEVRAYVQENPDFVKAMAFCISFALLASSLLAMINVLNVIFNPLQYLFAVYNAVFAISIVILEGKPEWTNWCGNPKTKLFESAAILASQTGRAMFYFYVGSINLFMLPANWLWRLVYISIGGGLCFVATMMLMDRWGCCQARQSRGSDSSTSASGSDSEV